jgi:cholesterol transport system auxiliary component
MNIHNAIKFIALCADSIWAKCQKHMQNKARSSLHRIGWAWALGILLTSCATPQAPTPKAVYDFGPVLSLPASPGPARQATLALPDFETTGSLDSPALVYRLQYADAHQLRPYAQARWSVPPAQLVRTRLRDALAAQGPVAGHEGSASDVLRVDLDEFSHVFESPEKSAGVIRLRVSLIRQDRLAAQTVILARAPAPSQDAAGGVRALTSASDEAIKQLLVWLNTHLR